MKASEWGFWIFVLLFSALLIDAMIGKDIFTLLLGSIVNFTAATLLQLIGV